MMLKLVRDRLNSYVPKTIKDVDWACAGVLIPILEKEGDLFILLTKRTEEVNVHKGEVSFPGGMCEATDKDTMTTALRECEEEVGIDRRDIEVIGRLDDTRTITGFLITPYVGLVPYPYPFKTNPKEVSYLIFLPFNELLKADPSFEQAEHMNRIHRVPAIYYNGDKIWGATCRMLLRLRDIVTNRC